MQTKSKYLSILLTVVIAITLFTPNNALAAGTVTVKSTAMNGWAFVQETSNGTGALVAGPATPPLNSGSARLTLDATGRELLGTFAYAGTRLDAITNLEYSTYRSSTNAGNLLAVTLQLDIDYDLTDANTAWQGRLVFEPYFTAGSGNIPEDTWQTWTPLTGMWWASGAPGNTVCPQASPCTLSGLLGTFPNAGLRASVGVLQFKAGGPWPGFDGNVDAFTIGVSGTDTTYDFEPEPPCTTVCYVDATNGNDANGGASIGDAKKTIQAAIDAVSANGTVRVLPGNYNETATNRFVLGANGPHQFGLFIEKDGITIQGVDASDAAITDYNALEAYITTNATNNFGASGIFVQGDDVTLAGLHIGPNIPGDNKTIEVIGDRFALKDSHVDVPGGGSVYFNDWQFDTGTDTSHVQSYTIDHNLIDQSTSIDFTSGAGYSGAVADRKIINNKFENAEYWPSISFNGSGTGVPWFVQSVGGAVIENNSFTNTFNGTDVTAAHIRVRGTVDNSQFDWTSYWNDNTFNKAVVALVGTYPPFDVRQYNYTSGPYSFDVRRIGVNIQSGIDKAQAGDTVLVKAGTYVEQVTVAESLDLVGESGANATFIKAPSTIPAASDPNSTIVKITGAGVNVDISGFTVTGPGPSGCGSIGSGIFVRDDAHAYIHDNKIVDIRDNPFSGCQNGIGIQVGRASLSTNGTADIESNTISGYQKNGITVSGATSDATITDNTITGAGPTATIGQNGIQISSGATAEINGNTVSGHSYTPFSVVSTGMLIFGAGDTNTSENIVSENQVGIYIIDTAGSHDGNTVSATSAGTGSAGFWGIIVDSPPPAHIPSAFEAETVIVPQMNVFALDTAAGNQVVTVTNNVLAGDGTSAGVGLEADSGFGSFDIDLTATNNYIQNWGVGVEIYECNSGCTGTDFANLKVNLNSITGNLTGYDHTNPTFTADGEKNWWGSVSGPSGMGPGAGDAVSSNVDFTPWLCDGTDTSAAIGFQPNVSTLCSAATKLIFSTQPGNGVAGSPLSTQPVVKAVDTDGNLDPNFNDAVTLTINNNPGSGTLGGTTTVSAVNGVATFTNISVSQPGVGYTLDANGGALTGATSAPFNVTAAGPAPAACLVYGVQDTGSVDTQFFTLDPVTKVTANLGPLYQGWDFETLDIDPTTGIIYAATSGGNAFNQKGHLFIIDGVDGSLFPVGPTGQKKVEALAFHPTDGTLWGWVSGKGLVTINKATGAATIVKADSRSVEGLAWNNSGTLLYFAKGKNLFSYNPANGKISTIAKNMPGSVEALDMRPDGLLAVGVDGKKILYAYDPVTNNFVSSQNITGLPYSDIEGISWPVCEP